MNHEQDRLFAYYIDETNKRLERIEGKIELLIEHRAMLLGRAKVLAGLIATITSLVVGGIEWIARK